MLHGKLIAKSCFSFFGVSDGKNGKFTNLNVVEKSHAVEIVLRLRHAFIKVTWCDEQHTNINFCFIFTKLLIYVCLYCVISLDWFFLQSFRHLVKMFHISWTGALFKVFFLVAKNGKTIANFQTKLKSLLFHI